jgi:tRNA threonylcarbamoyladenosine biosynthesis protein TsaB
MLVLGIDTATAIGSVGLIEGDKVIAEYVLNVVETHSARLMPALDEMMRRASVDVRDLNAIAVTRGPGSFTGVRVGVATAKGLAFALKKPIVGVISLDVLAFGLRFAERLICPMLDARRGEVYAAIYRGGDRLRRVSDYLCCPVEKVLEQIDEPTLFSGSGTRRYRDVIEGRLGERALFVEPIFDVPRGSAVAMLGLERLRRGEEDEPFGFVPFYIRRSEAEVKLESGALPRRSLI